MAAARGTEPIFEKVKNDTFDKLKALCSLSTDLDKRMPLTDQGRLSLSNMIGRKHKDAEQLFAKVSYFTFIDY